MTSRDSLNMQHYDELTSPAAGGEADIFGHSWGQILLNATFLCVVLYFEDISH